MNRMTSPLFSAILPKRRPSPIPEEERLRPPKLRKSSSENDAQLLQKILPLTRENLRLWQKQLAPGSKDATMPPSTTTIDAASEAEDKSNAAVDDSTRFMFYGIELKPLGGPLQNKEIEAHIARMMRPRPGPPSPAVRKMRDEYASAMMENEADAIKILADYLLFRDEAHEGERFLSCITDTPLEARFLPRPLIPAAPKLKRAKPDTTIGYITKLKAEALHVAHPFEGENELFAGNNPLLKRVHFPFLTCQWKQRAGQSHYFATNQGARDGATIVNYLHDFYTTAGCAPTVVDTCHWSLTCDLEFVAIWIHWREQEGEKIQHYMFKVDREFMYDLRDTENERFVRIRHILRNILDFSMKERLENITKALPAYGANSFDSMGPSATPRKRKASTLGSHLGGSGMGSSTP